MGLSRQQQITKELWAFVSTQLEIFPKTTVTYSFKTRTICFIQVIVKQIIYKQFLYFEFEYFLEELTGWKLKLYMWLICECLCLVKIPKNTLFMAEF